MNRWAWWPQIIFFSVIAITASCDTPANAQRFCTEDPSCEAAYGTCNLRRKLGEPHVDCEASLAICQKTCVWHSVLGPCRVVRGGVNLR